MWIAVFSFVLTPWTWFVVKDKEIPPVQEEDDEAEMMKKRHLNVVFIGHVGKLMNYKVFFAIISY